MSICFDQTLFQLYKLLNGDNFKLGENERYFSLLKISTPSKFFVLQVNFLPNFIANDSAK